MRIKVLNGYRGARTNEQYIEAGEYDASEPALRGCADYLVKNGHAVIVEPDAPMIEPEPPKPPVKRRK